MNARERVLREADAELLAPTGTGGLTGAVNSWDLSTGVDGPGTRFVVFTGGCPLRCLYCENPETWRMRGSPRTTVDELMAEIAKYRRFISVAGGGVTISGGEPLLQPAFTAEILHRCHTLGLHTALDTSGYLGDRADDALLADTDLVLLDIKAWTPALYRPAHRPRPRTDPALRRTAGRTPRARLGALRPRPRFHRRTGGGGGRRVVRRRIAERGARGRPAVPPPGRRQVPAPGHTFPAGRGGAPTAELVARIRSEFRAHGVTAR